MLGIADDLLGYDWLVPRRGAETRSQGLLCILSIAVRSSYLDM
jgi:hypothetical protein